MGCADTELARGGRTEACPVTASILSGGDHGLGRDLSGRSIGLTSNGGELTDDPVKLCRFNQGPAIGLAGRQPRALDPFIQLCAADPRRGACIFNR